MEGQLKFYKAECARLQKKLAENEEILKRMMRTNATLAAKLDKRKKKLALLKRENEVLNAAVQKWDCGMTPGVEGLSSAAPEEGPAPKSQTEGAPRELGQHMTATRHLAFGVSGFKTNESAVPTGIEEQLRSTMKFLQHYKQKNVELADKLHEKELTTERLHRENDDLRAQFRSVQAFDRRREQQTRFEAFARKVKLQELILQSFQYLGTLELCNVAFVCVSFYTRCHELLSLHATWLADFHNWDKIPRSRLWLRFVYWQYSRDCLFAQQLAHDPSPSSTQPKLPKGLSTSKRLVRGFPTPDRGKGDSKGAFFDCSYGFFENDLLQVEGKTPVDYSLMNAECTRCDPEDVFLPDFLTLHQYPIQQETANALPTTHSPVEEIEEILMDSQRLFSFTPCGQGIAFVAGFLYVVLQRKKTSVERMINVLLEEPYYLRKLFSDDFYLLNLIIFQIEHLLQHKLPDLYFHFKSENVVLHDFLIPWVMTLFTCQVLKQDEIDVGPDTHARASVDQSLGYVLASRVESLNSNGAGNPARN